jgi:hypothetical protein
LTADIYVFQYSNANDMHMTQNLNSFGEIIAHVQCSVDEKRNINIPCVPHKNNCKKKKGSHDNYCTGKHNYLLSNILRFALKINVMQLILVKIR